MLDTIRVCIPLTPHQHRQIKRVADARDGFQWAQVNPVTGEIRFVRVGGLADVDDGHSYHRELRWDIPPAWFDSQNCGLTLEFSIPKFWYGSNVHLLYDFLKALSYLKELLDKLFSLKGKSKLPDPIEWLLKRVDICYAWRFPSQSNAEAYLDSLAHLRFPRKKPTIHPGETIFFKGATYSLKFYLKLPEFRAHDLRELVKSGANYDWINHLEAKADGVLRCEATLRSQYLRAKKLRTIGDLLQKEHRFTWDEALGKSEGFNPELSFAACLSTWCGLYGTHTIEQVISRPGTSLPSGTRLEAPPGLRLVFRGMNYVHPGGGGIYEVTDKTTAILQGIILKFIGENSQMENHHQVREKLRAHFKPVKAARLLGVWLYVQKFGVTQAREEFGRDSFDRSRRDLRQAGISLVEMPKNLTVLDTNFLAQFRLQIPSPHVTNRVDDFRESDNVLNFVPRRPDAAEG
jgi:hypothetical protein